MADPFGDADSFLSGGSNVAAKWPKVDAVFEGDVVAWDGPVQMTDMDTGEPLYWEGSKKTPESQVKNMRIAEKSPAMQLLLHVQGPVTGITWETNQYIEKSLPDDDGMRTIYVHGELQKAIKKALTEAGASLEKGAHIWIARRKPVKKGNGFWGYTYEARWTPAPKDPNAALNAAGAPDEDDGDEPPF